MELKTKNSTEVNRYELKLDVTAEEFDEALQTVFLKERKKMTVPGFRKGKAPRGFIEKYYGDQVFFEAALEHIYPSIVSFAIENSELDVVSLTGFDVEKMSKSEGISCTVNVVTKPEVKIENYKGLSLMEKSVQVSEEEITQRIDAIRERNSRIVAVENRSAQDGDTVTIDFDGYLNGEAFDGGKSDNYELTIGKGQFIPGFEEQIIGHNIGDNFDIQVTFPDDYHADELKGKDAVFKIALHEIKEKVLPVFDEEFVKDVSEFDTIEAYKADIVRQLTEQKEQEKEQNIERQIVDQLTEKLEGDIPNEMVEKEIDEMMNSMAYRMQSQGLDLDTYMQYMGLTKETMREQYKPQALKQVQIRLALEEIAKIEAIAPSEEDIANEYKKMAEMYNMELEKVKSLVSEKTLVMDIANQKAMLLVREHAVFTEGEEISLDASEQQDSDT